MNFKKIILTAGFMSLATILAKGCGMWRDILIAANFGAGGAASAYFAASSLPMLLFDVVIGGAVSAAFIPIFNEFLQKDGKPAAMRFANNYINAIFYITTFITVVGIALSSVLISLQVGGFPDDLKTFTTQLLIIMFPMIIFTGLAYSFVGILQSFGEFNIPSVISLVSNAVVILYLFTLNNRFGVVGLAVTMLIGWALQAVIQIPHLIKFGYRYSPKISFNDGGLKKAGLLAWPILISTWAMPLASLVNMHLASYVGGGAGVAAMNYAYRLYINMVGVFAFVITNLIFPYLSRANAAGDNTGLNNVIMKSFKAVVLIITPIMTALILLARPVIRLIYMRGEFTEADVPLTSTVFLFYLIGMLAYAFYELLNKSFFAMHDSKTPMKISLVSMCINIVLSVILFNVMGLGGVALATAVGSIVNAIFLFILISKKQKGIFNKEDAVHFAKMIAAALVMAAVIWFVIPIVNGHFKNTFADILIPLAVGFAAYLVICAALLHKDMRKIIGK